MPNPTIAATHSLPCENVLRAGGANGVCTPMMFVRTTKRGGQSGESSRLREIMGSLAGKWVLRSSAAYRQGKRGFHRHPSLRYRGVAERRPSPIERTKERPTRCAVMSAVQMNRTLPGTDRELRGGNR